MGNKDKKRRRKYILLIVLGIIFVIGLLVFRIFNSSKVETPTLQYNDFKSMLADGKIEKVGMIRNQDFITVTDKDGKEYKVVNPKHDTFLKEVLESGITMDIAEEDTSKVIIEIVSALPGLCLTGTLIFLMVKLIGKGNDTLGEFEVLSKDSGITFDKIAGMKETKKEVMFAVEQLKNGEKLKKLGARPLHGLLLEGPPGNGKTLIAKAIAGEAGVNFIGACGSDFIQMFAGLGAFRVRKLWKLANEKKPCVIFIDEIDAIGGKRGTESGGAEGEYTQTINALLQKMDGLGSTGEIFVIAATNRKDSLDEALLRPGRFDKHLYIGKPDNAEDRKEIVDLYLADKKKEDNVTNEEVSKLLVGFSGAEIENTLNESVLISLQDKRKGVISLEDIDRASMKQLVSGVEVEHRSEDDKNIAAVHEVGHTIINRKFNREVVKVSILPYSSGVGGITLVNGEDIERKKFRNRNELIEDIKVLLGGTVAEEIVFGDITNGASNDLERATEIAYQIVHTFGMNKDTIANFSVLQNHNILFNGEDVASRVNEILIKAKEDVKESLILERGNLDRLVEVLKDKEVIFGEQIDEVLGIEN